MFRRGINWKLIIKCTWVATSLSIWLLGLGSCITEPSCFFAQNNVLPFAILISFPSGLLFLIFAGPFMGFGPSIDYSLLCLGISAVGYFQWFHVVPELFGKPHFTLLCLNELKPAGAGEKEMPAKRVKPAKPAKLRPRRILHFDKAGRTPLERAINKEQRSKPTNVL
jgi:hypothetical protein